MAEKIRYAGIPLVVLTALWFLWAMLEHTDGGLSMPLDDSFIYFTFARNTAQGHILSWTPGGGFSSAATSWPWVFVLACGHACGFRGELLVLWAFLCGVGCTIAAFFMTIDLVRRSFGEGYKPWMGLLGGALFALSGLLAWGYLSGMEIPLMSVAMLACLVSVHRLLSGDGRARLPLAVWGSILGVMRPEGLIVAILLVALLVIRPLLRRDRRRAVRRLAWAGIAAPALAAAAATWALTGHLASAAMLQKSYFYEPAMTAYMFVDLTTQNIAKVATGLYSGFYFYDGSPLLLTPLFFLGLVPAMVREARDRSPGLAWLSAAWFFVGSLSTMMSLSSDDHHFRYQIPFYHLYLVWSVVGVGALVRAVRERWRPVAWPVAAYFLLATALSLPRWADTYGMNCKNIFDQQIRMAHIIDRILPDDALVGINDAGAIPYYANRRTFDVLGLATEGQSRWFRSGPGSLYERFENLERDERPDFFAIYPEWFFFKEIFTQKIASVRLGDNTICGADEKVLYRADWSVLGRGASPGHPHAAAMSPVDGVDVADLDSEAAHGFDGPAATVYAAYPYPEPGQSMPTTQEEAEKLRWGPVVADGGRRLSYASTAMEMSVQLAGGKDVVIVGRVECRDLPATLHVTVDGERVGEWRLSPSPGFAEPESLLPAGYIHDGGSRIGLEYDGEASAAVFHLWFYQ